MSDREEARELLGIAERELRALGGMDDRRVFADEIFGFLVQQALEKCLKAWLSIRGLRYRFTHEIAELVGQLDDAGEDTTELHGLASWTQFAVELRYSGGALDVVPIDRPAAISRVESLYGHVKEIVDAAPEEPEAPAEAPPG